MKVEPMMDIGMYEVESSEGFPHIVDLTAEKGIGYCTCNNYSVVCSPNIKKGKGQRRCKHILAAKEYEKGMKE